MFNKSLSFHLSYYLGFRLSLFCLYFNLNLVFDLVTEGLDCYITLMDPTNELGV